VFSGKIEMGQGVLTSQAQMVAEELGVDLGSIDMVLGDTEQCPWDMGTFGSLTTRMFGPALRAAAAKARATLLSLAARKLGVRVETLTIKDGIVSAEGEPKQSISFGELSRGAKIAYVVDQKAVLKSVVDFKVMGQSPVRLDALDKVTGAAKYAADIKIPDMVYAKILRPPMHGATLSQIDTSGAESLPGITVVSKGDFVAVLSSDPEAAESALGRIKADWKLPEAKLDPNTIFGHLISRAAPMKAVSDRGDVALALSTASRLFKATYYKGYVAHAAIEPHAAVAKIDGGKLTVWASTQTPFPLRDQLAKVLGLDLDKVRVITPYVGGGFGGKSSSGQAIEAARLAQITGKPVQVAWTRSEEFFNDTFDPASVVTIVSAIDQSGRISLWDQSIYSAGARGAASCYDIPNARFQASSGTSYGVQAAGPSLHPFAVGPWRAPGANMNVFAIESQVDVMASAANEDPLAFRLRHLTDSRMRKVLQAAADAFGWKAASAPSKSGVGIACSIDAGSYVATIAQVKVDPATGHVKVIRIVSAQDMGTVVNPEGAKMQIEGGLTMGLGYTLAEELRFLGGEILDNNFDTYDLPRFSWVPRIETVLVRNDDLAPQGCGEPAITTTGAAIANAIFDATGVRMFRLPITADRVHRAIAELAT
jgi:isoquinoline 1-oxidoreductase